MTRDIIDVQYPTLDHTESIANKPMGLQLLMLSPTRTILYL